MAAYIERRDMLHDSHPHNIIASADKGPPRTRTFKLSSPLNKKRTRVSINSLQQKPELNKLGILIRTYFHTKEHGNLRIWSDKDLPSLDDDSVSNIDDTCKWN